jgi:hypothetical protein
MYPILWRRKVFLRTAPSIYVSHTVEDKVVSKNSSHLYVSHIVEEEAVISGEKLYSMHPTTVKEYTPHCGGEKYVLE